MTKNTLNQTLLNGSNIAIVRPSPLPSLPAPTRARLTLTCPLPHALLDEQLVPGGEGPESS